MSQVTDPWNNSDPYEYFMGRWSRLVAPAFLAWLNAYRNLSWIDIGCGTGALSYAIYQQCKPAALCCVDLSPEFLEKTKEKLQGHAEFLVGSASKIPSGDNRFDVVVSGLALNFFPDIPAAFSEMKRVLKPNGVIALYVWDYADRMDMLRIFWDAARNVDPAAYHLDEGVRFPICNIDKLKTAFETAGLVDIKTTYLNIPTVFKDFDDYWVPFLGGQGPAPGYLVAQNEDIREQIKADIHKRLPVEPGGSIKLLARAIAICGKNNK